MQDPRPPPPQGLSTAEAKQRLLQDGANELSAPNQRTLLRIGIEIVSEPMFLLLLSAGTLYLVLGDLEDAAMLLAFVLLTGTITVLQELRTERSLQALRALSSPRALVLRDGVQQRIAGRDVVLGDWLVLADGDRVAADARLISANDLQLDESLLTGESMPVAKFITPLPDDSNDDLNNGAVYAGTLVVSGQGLAEVTATGKATRMGGIGATLQTIEMPPTPLQQQTRQLVRWFSALGMALSGAMVVLFGWLRGDWYAGLLAGITLAMSMLPEEFILITTVFMAMGAWRLSVHRVLARRSATIEALGAATVLCTDKTGTLTRNQMAVAELAIMPADGADLRLWVQDQTHLPDVFLPLLEYAILASEPAPLDPMDKALLSLGTRHLPAENLHPDWRLVHEYGLSPACMAMTHVWQAPHSNSHRVAIKGGVEVVLALSHLDPEHTRMLTDTALAMAARGLRVLAVAQAQHAGQQWPPSPQGFDYTLLGLVGLADPLRPGVPQAIQACHDAGIRVLMMTGDHPVTAKAIGAQAGLLTRNGVITGAELATLNDAALSERIRSCTLFARVQPEQKLRILQALQAQGEVVAMTGDGVNDAPALKAAHIGIAMGGRGTDVAREAAALVLLDDDFGAILKAISLGRRIDDNLRKAFAFALAVHVPIAGLSLMPLLLNLPLMLAPVHVAFLELLISPVCSLVFESEAPEKNAMQRPPRPRNAPLISKSLITSSLLQGVLVWLVVTALFALLLYQGKTPDQARTASFTALVVSNMALIFNNRLLAGGILQTMRQPNPVLWGILSITVVLMGAILLVAPLRALFHFALLEPGLLLTAVGLGGMVLMLLLGFKRVYRQPAYFAP